MGKKKQKRQRERKSGESSPVPRPLEKERVQSRWEGIVHDRFYQVLAILTLIALFLRLYHLDYNSLWLDEAATYDIAKKSVLGIWELIGGGGDVNPPLFYWIEHFMLSFGTSETVLRIVPAIVGTLTVPVAFLAGKKFCTREVGLILAAFFTFSPFHLFYSQEARAYTLMLLFFISGFYFFLDGLEKNTTLSWILFGIFFSLIFWTHFYAMVAYVILLLYAGVSLFPSVRKDIKKSLPFLTGLGAFFIGSLPLIMAMIKLYQMRTASPPTWGIQGWGIVSATFTQLSGYNPLLMILLIFAFIGGTAILVIRQLPKALLLISGLVLSLLASYVLSFRMPMVPRYLIFLLLFYFLGIACLFLLLPKRWRTWSTLGLGILIIALINVPAIVDYYSHYSKEDWRGFSTIMAGTAHDGDAIVILPSYIDTPFNFYYDNKTHGTIEYGANTRDEIVQLVQEKGNASIFFVVTSDISAANPNGDVIKWLGENGKLMQQYYGIYLFTLR